ncbi:MAG: hypothetical protein ACYC7E_14055 [Armatimonadota bacterium]
MNTFTRYILVPLAILVALVIITLSGLRGFRVYGFSRVIQALSEDASDEMRPEEFSRTVYPFPWQSAQRERLHAVLQRPNLPPTATDEMGLARYAEYALMLDLKDLSYESVMREGLRREPDNALYHYLLAYRWLKDAIAGDPPRKDQQTKKVTFRYVVKDRPLLDRAMRELAISLDLPYRTHRAVIARAQLAALPPVDHYEDQLAYIGVLADVRFPDFTKLREFARVNGYYLSLLLAEGRRAEAEPYLRTGEKLIVQLMQDDPPTLISSLVALALSAIFRDADSQVCRQYGMTREAARLHSRLTTLTDSIEQFKVAVKNNKAKHEDHDPVQRYSNLLASILLPVFGNQVQPTPEEMAPSRLLDYIMIEMLVASLLPVALLLFMLYAWLKIIRWRLISSGQAADIPDMPLSAAGWRQVLLLGYLLPLALYLLCRAIPLLSGRAWNLTLGVWFFGPELLLVLLWMLIVPAAIAAADIQRRAAEDGIVDERPGQARALRIAAAILGLAWVALAWKPLNGFATLLVLSRLPIDLSQVQIEMWFDALLAVALLLLPLVPVLWERRRAHLAPREINIARAAIAVYAALILLTAPLLPALRAQERHYLRTDRVMSVMDENGIIAFTGVEGRLVLGLRRDVLDQAKKLGIPLLKP